MNQLQLLITKSRQDLGENFLDGKCMQSDRLVYNNILEIRERMRNFHYCLGHISMILALFFISSSITDVNLGIAQNTKIKISHIRRLSSHLLTIER